MSEWQPIDQCEPEGGAILIYSPILDADKDFPGHPIVISNRKFVSCGNAAHQGFTHFMALPATP